MLEFDQAIDLEGIVAEVIEKAGQAGATGVSAVASQSRGFESGVRMGEPEGLEQFERAEVSITVYQDGRRAAVNVSGADPASLATAVADAMRLVGQVESDAYARVVDAKYLATDFPDLDLDHPADIDLMSGLEKAQRTEAAAMAVHSTIENSEGAQFSAVRVRSCLGNSAGLLASSTSTRYGLGCTVVACAEGNKHQESWFESGRKLDALADAEYIGHQAGTRAVAKLRPRTLESCQVPVLFEAPAAKSLVGHLTDAISGGAQYRRSSYLLDALGEKVMPDFLTIHENPHLPMGLASGSYDIDGVATRKGNIIQDGVIGSYLLGAYAARRLGREPTGHGSGTHNLEVSHGDKDWQALLAEVGTGLVITDLMGFGVNGVTGDYSRGCAGFWVEDGAIAYPVEEVTVAGNLRRMFQDIRTVGADVDRRGRLACGSILIDGMTIAGQ